MTSDHDAHLRASARRTIGCVAAGVGLAALFWLTWRFDFGNPPLVGPSPREIRETCAPIVEWIQDYRLEHGVCPEEALPSEFEMILESLPYSYSYVRVDPDPTQCFLTIGSMDEWPYPLYSYEWRPDEGWYWGHDTGGPMSEQRAARILAGHGYPE